MRLNAFSTSPPDFAAKNAIFRSSKNANFVKNVATNPEFRQFRQKSIFSSPRPVFVISSVFRQKRNPLEPNYYVLFIRTERSEIEI